jgi:hypothetical protein
MVQARIHQGRIQVDEPIPEAWEGRLVKIVPLTPDDPLVDLDGRLAALAELGPVEFECGERESIAQVLVNLDHFSRDAMQRTASNDA